MSIFVGPGSEAWLNKAVMSYQLIITMPISTWIHLAETFVVFIGVLLSVAYFSNKRISMGWSLFSGLIGALAICIPMIVGIDFGPTTYPPTKTMVALQMPEVSEAAKAHLCGDTTGKVLGNFEEYCAQRRAWMEQHGTPVNNTN